MVRAATGTVTTKINEIYHGSSFSAESPTEVRFVTACFGPRPFMVAELGSVKCKFDTRYREVELHGDEWGSSRTIRLKLARCWVWRSW
jgi:hypothetical protein